MIWENEAAGLPLTEEAVSCIEKEADELSGLSAMGNLVQLPGIEGGTEKDLGVSLIRWAGSGGSPLPEPACRRLEQGTAVLYGMSRYAMKRVERLLKYADLALAMNLEAIRVESDGGLSPCGGI